MVFFHGFVFISGCYFLPLYFQAVRGSSVLISGISILPYVIVLSIASAINGHIISRTGRYQEPLWAGSILMVVGTGLFANLDRTSSWVKIIFYQVLAGAGAGPAFQGPLIAIHSIIKQVDVGTATTTYAFLRSLATALGISLGLVVFQNVMDQQATRAIGNPNLSPEGLRIISGGSASSSVPLIKKLPIAEANLVRDLFGKGLQAMWWFFLACTIMAALASLGIGKHHLSTTVNSNQPLKRRKKKDEEKQEEKQEEKI